MTNQQGWIKIHRQFLDWEWYDDANVKILFLHLLLKSNYTDKNWRGVNIKRGQLVTGRFKLSKETGLTQQQVRTSLDKLISTNEITKSSTPNYTLITIVNYDKYQSNEPTNEPTNNQRVTTTKNNKKEKKYINLLKDKVEKGFDIFWAKYPNKKGKVNAKKAFIKKAKDIETLKEIITGLDKVLVEWKDRDKQYIPHPATWLNGERWEDELLVTDERPARPRLT